MTGVQTLDFQSTLTRFNNHILEVKERIDEKRRFKIGCGVSECELLNVIYIGNILCKDKCYIEQDMVDKIHDYLIVNKNG